MGQCSAKVKYDSKKTSANLSPQTKFLKSIDILSKDLSSYNTQGERLTYINTILEIGNSGGFIKGGQLLVSGNKSIYGQFFEDENSSSNADLGTISTDNQGIQNANSSRFILQMSHQEEQNDVKKRVVFGKIKAKSYLELLKYAKKINSLKQEVNSPFNYLKVIKAGIQSLESIQKVPENLNISIEQPYQFTQSNESLHKLIVVQPKLRNYNDDQNQEVIFHINHGNHKGDIFGIGIHKSASLDKKSLIFNPQKNSDDFYVLEGNFNLVPNGNDIQFEEGFQKEKFFNDSGYSRIHGQIDFIKQQIRYTNMDTQYSLLQNFKDIYKTNIRLCAYICKPQSQIEIIDSNIPDIKNIICQLQQDTIKQLQLYSEQQQLSFNQELLIFEKEQKYLEKSIEEIYENYTENDIVEQDQENLLSIYQKLAINYRNQQFYSLSDKYFNLVLDLLLKKVNDKINQKQDYKPLNEKQKYDYKALCEKQKQTTKNLLMNLSKISLSESDDQLIQNLIIIHFEYAYLLKLLGDIDQALTYYQSGLELQEKFYDCNHIALTPSIDSIAQLYLSKQMYDVSLQQFFRSLKIQKDYYKYQDDIQFQLIYQNIAKTYFKKRDYSNSLDYYQKCVQLQISYYNNNQHINLIPTYLEICLVYNEQGQKNKALELLDTCERIQQFNTNQINNLTTSLIYEHKAYIYRDNKQYNLALQYFQKQLEQQQQYYNTIENHIDLALTIENIGIVYYQQGDYESALNNQLKSLSIKEQYYKLDKFHIHLASSFINLGIIYDDKRVYNLALENFKKAYVIKQKHYKDENNIHFLGVLQNLGVVCKNLGDYTNSIFYNQKALDILEENLQNDNIEKVNEDYKRQIQILQQLGYLYAQQSLYSNSLNIYYKILEIYQSNQFGEINSQDHFKVLENIGNIFNDQENYEQALQYYDQALKIKKTQTSQETESMADLYVSISQLYRKQSKNKECLDLLENAIKIKENMCLQGKDKLKLVSVIGALGIYYREQQQYDKALEYFQQILNIQTEYYKEESNVDMADTYGNIGITYDEKYNYEKALDYYDKALKIIKNHYQKDDHIEMVPIISNKGVSFQNMKNYDEALACYKKCCQICSSYYKDPNHPLIMNSLQNMATINYKVKRNYGESIVNYEHLIKIKKEIYKTDEHPSFIKIYETLSKLYDKQHNSTKVYYYLQKVIVIKDQLYSKDISQSKHKQE